MKALNKNHLDSPAFFARKQTSLSFKHCATTWEGIHGALHVAVLHGNRWLIFEAKIPSPIKVMDCIGHAAMNI